MKQKQSCLVFMFHTNLQPLILLCNVSYMQIYNLCYVMFLKFCGKPQITLDPLMAWLLFLRSKFFKLIIIIIIKLYKS